MKKDEERIDLSPLDPENDPDRVERVVDRVMDRLGPGLVPDRRSLAWEVERFLARRVRAISVAAVLVLVAAFAYRTSAPSGERGDPQESGGRTIAPLWTSLIQTEEAAMGGALLMTFQTVEERP